MRIVIAAWHLKDPNVGIGRYCRELIRGIAQFDPNNQYTVLVPGRIWDGRLEGKSIRFRRIVFPVFRRRFWEQAAPLMVGRYDLLHFPYDSAVAWKRGRFIATIHDVKPMIFPELRRRENLWTGLNRQIIADKWKQMDHIMTVSKSSLHDIITRIGVDPDRVTVVYPGVDLERFCPISEVSESSSEFGGLPFILSVAGSDPTKNLEALVEAFSFLPRSIKNELSLVLAGDMKQREDLRRKAQASGVEERVFFPGRVSDDRLIQLYQQAEMFVFPSRYEGFGFPVLEALACGCPVICSNTSSLPEVAGEAAVFVDPLDIEGLSKAIEQVVVDGTLQARLRRQGPLQASYFTWERSVRETVALYRDVAG